MTQTEEDLASSTALTQFRLQGALAQRVRAAADLLLDVEDVTRDLHDAQVLPALFVALAEYAELNQSDELVWLLLIVATGELPISEAVVEARRRLELRPADGSALWLMDLVVDAPVASMWNTIDIAEGAVLVETDFSAKHNLHTGIQRVTRSTVPIWERTRDMRPVVWTDAATGMRALREDEHVRLMRWSEKRDTASKAAKGDVTVPGSQLIVPWHSVVVLVEVPTPASCDRLSAVGQFTDNRIVAIGYDCIPVVSADLVGPDEPNKFVEYLRVVKYSRRIAGISESATLEFLGFTEMLPTQGLIGPIVLECELGTDKLDAADSEPVTTGELPVVLSVGSIEERKNQLALLAAAEQLWRDGMDFRLRFIGGGASSTGRRMLSRVATLRSQGRPVSVETGVSEAELSAAFRGAHCTVFASLHEGYGLPVAESFAYGIPAITSRYGSTAEIGRYGGVELVDPRDDNDIARALRILLTDTTRRAELIEQIARQPQRTWQEYADELWAALVVPELESLELAHPKRAGV